MGFTVRTRRESELLLLHVARSKIGLYDDIDDIFPPLIFDQESAN